MNHTQNAVTIILGEKQCGKTALARQLSENKKTVWLSYHYLDGFGLSPIDETTELIVIDGAASISEIKRFITQPMLVIERKGRSPITLPRPKTIVVSNAFKAHQFLDVPHAKAYTLQCVKNHKFLVIQGSTSTGKSSFLNGLKHLFTSKN